MNHLSPQQIDEWVIGERRAEVDGHLQSCRLCADEVARAAGPLAMFGGAVRSWGEEQMAPLRPWAPAENRFGTWRWRVGLAIATLLLLIAAPVYRQRQATREAALTAAQTTAQDEILLRQVERAISQSVPAPMEPLAKLMPNDFSR